jgi:hypothetical protein
MYWTRRRRHSGRFRRRSSAAGQHQKRRLFRWKRHSRSGDDRIDFARHQHREGTEIMEAAGDLARLIACSKIDVCTRWTDNG